MIARAMDRGASFAAMVLLPLAVRRLPLPLLLRACDRIPAAARARATPTGLADRVHRWLARGGGPWESTCLTRSTVLYALLKYHGHRPTFFIGVRGPHDAFAAHAWVTLGGVPVSDAVGGDGYVRIMSHGV